MPRGFRRNFRVCVDMLINTGSGGNAIVLDFDAFSILHEWKRNIALWDCRPTDGTKDCSRVPITDIFIHESNHEQLKWT